jgi:hypothetical protein
MESIWSIPLLCAAAFAGGAVNAIAGGGTLLTFPTLLTLLSPVAANATSTMALLPGSLAAALGYRRELASNGRMLMLLWPPSLVGGIPWYDPVDPLAGKGFRVNGAVALGRCFGPAATCRSRWRAI